MASKRAAAVEQLTKVARQFPEDGATAGQIDLIDEICAKDVVDYSPMGEVRGRKALKAQLKGLRTAFTDFSATVEDVVTEEDTVAMRVTLRGTHEGEFMGVEPTGRRFEVANMVFTRVEDGQIAERWVIPDTLGILQQLGIEDLSDLEMN